MTGDSVSGKVFKTGAANQGVNGLAGGIQQVLQLAVSALTAKKLLLGDPSAAHLTGDSTGLVAYNTDGVTAVFQVDFSTGDVAIVGTIVGGGTADGKYGELGTDGQFIVYGDPDSSTPPKPQSWINLVPDGYSSVAIDGPLMTMVTGEATSVLMKLFPSTDPTFPNAFTLLRSPYGSLTPNQGFTVDDSGVHLTANGHEASLGTGGIFATESISMEDSTTPNPANVSMNTITGVFQRSTSSSRYKTDIVDANLDPTVVDRLRPTRHHRTDDDGERLHVSLIAEEVAELTADGVVLDGEGKPDEVNWPVVTQHVIAALQDTRAQLKDALARLEALESAHA